MAISYVAYPGSPTTTAELVNFIPQLWSDEIIAAYKSNLVLAPLAVTMNHVGKKGDTIHIPVPARADASAKAEGAVVTVISNVEGTKPFVIDEHWEYSRLIEDLVKIQAIDTYRAFYTDDAGYALGKKVDTDLGLEAAGFQDSTAYQFGKDGATAWSAAYIGGNGTTVYDGVSNETALADAGIRRSIQRLDDADVPSARRVMVVPPVEKSNLLAASSGYLTYHETGEAGNVRNGYVGDIHGLPVYVTTNAPDVTGGAKGVLIFQREAIGLIEQMRPRTQTQYKQEYLADLFTADIIYDTILLRPEAGVTLVVPV